VLDDWSKRGLIEGASRTSHCRSFGLILEKSKTRFSRDGSKSALGREKTSSAHLAEDHGKPRRIVQHVQEDKHTHPVRPELGSQDEGGRAHGVESIEECLADEDCFRPEAEILVCGAEDSLAAPPLPAAALRELLANVPDALGEPRRVRIGIVQAFTRPGDTSVPSQPLRRREPGTT
jgi:hypothetical protein